MPGQISPIGSGTSSKPDAGYRNFASTLPEVYIGHPNRIERYNQYEQMDMDSEVNAALDILAEFCSQKNTENKTPFDIHFHDNPTDNEVKIIKEQLNQWVALNQLNKRIFKIVRNTLKYGDQVFIRDPETFKLFWTEMSKVTKVIVNESEGKKPEQYIVKDLNPNFQNLTVTAVSTSDTFVNHPQVGGPSGAYVQPRTPYSGGSRFSHAQNEAVINAEHVVHISLTEGLDIFWPFGNSVLENVFKVFKQKELLEDSIIIYRVQRAPERRMFKIDVGNMPSHMAMAFVDRIKNEISQRRIPTQTGGGCFAMNTRVPLLDGRTLSLTQLTEEFNNGKPNWAYSCDPVTGKMVPGLITWAGITQKSAEVIELTLDNGEIIICTPEHKFPIIGKGFVQAQDIIPEKDSLISFNIRECSIKEKGNTYIQIYDHESKSWQFVHREISKFMAEHGSSKEMLFDEQNINKPKKLIHHLDFNRYNNEPNNLVYMSWIDHKMYHSSCFRDFLLTRTPDEIAQFRAKAKETRSKWSKEKKIQHAENISIKNKQAHAYKKQFCAVEYEKIKKRLLENLMINSKLPWPNQLLQSNYQMLEIILHVLKTTEKKSLENIILTLNNNQEFMSIYRELNQKQDKKCSKLNLEKITVSVFRNILRQHGYNWKSLLKSNDYSIQKPSRKINWHPEMLKVFVDHVVFNKIESKAQAAKTIIDNEQFMKKFVEINSNIKGNAKTGYFSENTLNVFLRDNGFSNWTDFKNKLPLYNHRIVSIKKLETRIPVGTLTIDNEEIYHGYHTFAIEQGVYTKNSNMMDATYNPLSTHEDYFFPQTADGRGSSVEILPGGQNLGEITDLKFFTNKLFRGLRIPASYLPTGTDDGTQAISDGKVGTALIQEWRFNQYCTRLQSMIIDKLDTEFKMFMRWRGINIDGQLFELIFNPPQNFAQYRQADIDSAKIQTFTQLEQYPYLSKRFLMKRYLGLSEMEMAENEIMWAEEHGEADESSPGQAQLRNVGITPGGIQGDLEGIAPLPDTGTAPTPEVGAEGTPPPPESAPGASPPGVA